MWKSSGGDIIAEFEDGSTAVLTNKFGKGAVITILTDAKFAVQNLPDLTRDALDYALEISGNKPLIDIIGANENFDSVTAYTENGFQIALVNHNAADLEITVKSPIKISRCVEQKNEAVTKPIYPERMSVPKLKLSANDFRVLECG